MNSYRQKGTSVQSVQHPQRGPHNNFQRTQSVFQPGRGSEEFNRGVYNTPQQHYWHYQANPNVRHLQNSGLQQATGNPPHDMSKQTPLPPQHNQTTGLYGPAPSSAVVSGPGGQQMPGASQSQVPGPSQSAQNVAVQSQGQQQMVGRNQAPMTVYYSQRTAGQRSMHPPMQRPINPAMTISSQQANPTAQFQPQCMYPTNPLNPYMPAHPQAQMLMGPITGFPQRGQYASAPQYTVPSSQQMYFQNAAGSFSSYVPTPSFIPYQQFHQLPMQPQNRPPNMNQMNQGAMVAEQKKTQKKIITIQNPETGEDLTEQIMSNATTSSPPLNVSSTLKGTPSPDAAVAPGGNEIAAQFAAQVAAVATPVVVSKPNLPVAPVAPIPLQETPTMDYVENVDISELDSSNNNNVELDNDIDIVNSPVHSPDLVCEAPQPECETFDGEMPAASNAIEEKAPYVVDAALEEGPALLGTAHAECEPEEFGAEEDVEDSKEVVETNGPIESTDGIDDAVPETVALEIEVEEVCARPDDSKNSLEAVSEVVEPASTSLLEAADASPAEAEIKGTNYTKPPSRKQSYEKETEAVAALEPSKVPSDELKAVEGKKDLHQQQNGDVAETRAPSSIPGRESEAKETRKNTRKKREKELNRKGDSKEGGEMDAFVVDKETKETIEHVVQAPPSISPVVPPPSKSPSPVAEVTTAATTTTTIVASQDEAEKDAIEEEKRRVARKNEENARVSQEALKSDLNTAEETGPPLIEPPKPQIKLPYEYKEDQWSPINLEGKKQYDRDFLLKLSKQPMSIRKPEGLPNLDIMKAKGPLHNTPDHRASPGMPLHPRSHAADFTPAYIRVAAQRMPQGGGGNIGRRQSQQGRGGTEKRKIISSSLSQEVKLHHSENAWKPMHKPNNAEADEELKTQELYKKVRGVLNKLTPQKFQTLVDQVRELPIDTEDRLKGVIDLVFEKAVDEPNFSVPYANMCKQLAMLKVPLQGGREDEYVNFRKLLLNKCQREFEKDTSEEIKREERLKLIESAETDEKRKMLEEELEEEGRKARRRSTGNIRFIGELFKLNMLLPAIMHDCINKLLKQGDEESLECLCRLLMTVGKDLDMDEAKKTAGSAVTMDSCFKSMEKIVKMKQTSSRVRFMLQDVIELRMNKWIPRRDENNPKTIDQIHKEAQKELQEQHMMLQHIPLPSKRPADDRRKNRGNMGGALHGSDDGWQTSKSSLKMKPPILTQVVSLSQPVEVDSLQLGPQWTKQSSSTWLGGAKSSSGSDSKQNLGNRYQCLQEQSSQSESRRGNQRSAASSRDSSRGRPNQYSSLRKTPSQGIPCAEREQAVNAVKNIIGFSASEQKPPSSKESPSGRASASKEREVILKGVNLPPEEFERRTGVLIDQFLHNSDFEDTIQCVQSLANPSNISALVSEAINHILERSSQARTMVGKLFNELVVKKVVTVDQYLDGLKRILEFTDDLAIDIPNLWVYLGELVAPMLQKNAVPLNSLKAAAQHCIENGTGGLLMKEVLRVAAKSMGSGKVADMWKASGIQWSEILGPKEDVDTFLKNGLEFLVMPDAVEPKPTMLEDVREHLLELMAVNSDIEDLFVWIDKHVSDTKDPKFIRALVTAAVERSIQRTNTGTLTFEKPLFHEYAPLLQKYLDHAEHLELQAVYALQVLVNRLQHPQGMLWNIFSTLYDEDILSEDAFLQWERSEDPAEQEGRGVALKSVASFFTWLKETEATDD